MKYFWKKKTIVSFILSLFVVAIHTYAIKHYSLDFDETNLWNLIGIFFDYLFRETIVQIAVPLFFIISGATFFRNYKNAMYFDKIKSRIKTLIIPYLIWNTVWMVFNIICSYTAISNYFFEREKFSLTVGGVIESILFYKCNGVFWFIYDLIIFVLIAPIFDFFTTKKWTSCVVLTAILAINVFFPNALSFLKLNTSSLFYYFMGVIIGKYYMDVFMNKKDKKTVHISLCICIIFIILKMVSNYGIVEINQSINIIILSISALSFWNSMDLFCTKLKQKNYMNKSFFIYATHGNIVAVIATLAYLALPKRACMAVPCFVISYVSTILLIIIFAKILQSRFPKFYSIISGDRG